MINVEEVKRQICFSIHDDIDDAEQYVELLRDLLTFVKDAIS